MTNQKPELMPDKINVCVDTMQIKDFENKYTTSYTRTDLYTAACAERDALRELCEGMIKIIEDAIENGNAIEMRSILKSHRTAYEKHKAGE